MFFPQESFFHRTKRQTLPPIKQEQYATIIQEPVQANLKNFGSYTRGFTVSSYKYGPTVILTGYACMPVAFLQL